MIELISCLLIRIFSFKTIFQKFLLTDKKRVIETNKLNPEAITNENILKPKIININWNINETVDATSKIDWTSFTLSKPVYIACAADKKTFNAKITE